MAYPEKFKQLLEISSDQIELPDYLWLTYAVCACTPDACGWGGWMIEVAFKKTAVRYSTGTGDKPLPAMNDQICPACGKELFRTEASLRFEISADQTPVHGIPGADYETTPMEYE